MAWAPMAAQIERASVHPAIPGHGVGVFGPTLAAVLVEIFVGFVVAYVLN